METRARKTLHNLVLPIYDQISSERQVRAEMEVKYDKVLNRLMKLEMLLGASNKKPKMIEDVEEMIRALREQESMDVAFVNAKLDELASK